MKNKKHFAVLTIMMILSVTAIAGFVKNSSQETQKQSTNLISGKDTPEKNFKGASEFYFTGENDGRIWHVMNLYSAGFSNDSDEYNNSYYCFGKDTVTVVNRFFVTDKEEMQTNLAVIP